MSSEVDIKRALYHIFLVVELSGFDENWKDDEYQKK